MSEPITFNASGAVLGYCDRNHYLCTRNSEFAERNKDMQIRIDPDADTAEIEMPSWGGKPRNHTISGVFFTTGTTIFSKRSVFQDDDFPLTYFRSRILLPGPAASGFQWASHSVWSEYFLYQDIDFEIIEFLDAGAMSFGILTKTKALPDGGVTIFTGFMSGVYVAGPFPSSAFRISGNVWIEVDFAAGTMTGIISGISANDLDPRFFLEPPVFDDEVGLSAQFDKRDFKGTIGGSRLHGDLVGTFYGPSGDELGISFQKEGSAIGAISVRR